MRPLDSASSRQGGPAAVVWWGLVGERRIVVSAAQHRDRHNVVKGPFL
jgi:hypothetical protein